MFNNVHIVGIAAYHPKCKVENCEFLERFRQCGQEEHLKHLMSKVGRKVRTHAKDGENSITMSVEAANKALEKAGIKAADIDIIISATDTPEYLMPSCAMIIRNKIGANKAKVVFDMNSNCVSMVNAMDVAWKYLKTDKKYKRAMIVGSLVVSPFTKMDDMITSPLVGDGGAAVILEAREELEERGFLNSGMFTDDSYNETIRFPACGLQNIAKEAVDINEKKMQWNPFDFSFLSEEWTKLINSLLEERNIKAKDISGYFMSQFSKEDIMITMDNLGVDARKATFVADKYGYTGTASPIMALNDTLNEKNFNKDEYIIFCSVGAGYIMGAMLYRW
ncbi:ketoacyl-ACP synthase III [Oceanirhabdus sp. W0125-5]|uniref:ketoacyl-ACP synthase III n=1 Tax=Oceanirhabdus sp. W0125-5 TaxID=2999116 RepID=UPI0022F348EE|nr:ketoacyl-ACP synthase III [Oceanirhabdus sp. W0125-5]WBW96880.1 ketoacyl-ACP synthase III [Oceanirhabdus sp. W0125-5]